MIPGVCWNGFLQAISCTDCFVCAFKNTENPILSLVTKEESIRLIWYFALISKPFLSRAYPSISLDSRHFEFEGTCNLTITASYNSFWSGLGLVTNWSYLVCEAWVHVVYQVRINESFFTDWSYLDFQAFDFFKVIGSFILNEPLLGSNLMKVRPWYICTLHFQSSS